MIRASPERPSSLPSLLKVPSQYIVAIIEMNIWKILLGKQIQFEGAENPQFLIMTYVGLMEKLMCNKIGTQCSFTRKHQSSIYIRASVFRKLTGSF